jgi:CO/xanthine dehydrogenase Mo-binding subunit
LRIISAGEFTCHPKRAKVVTDNLADHLVAVNPDTPPIDCSFVEEKDEHVNSPGVKGILPLQRGR